MAAPQRSQQSPRSTVYLIAAGVAALGLVVTGILVTGDSLDELRQVRAVRPPADTVVAFAEAGTYVIYAECKAGTSYAHMPAADAYTVSITPAGGAAPLPLRRRDPELDRLLGKRLGVALYEFTVPAAGDYAVRATATPGAAGHALVISPGSPRRFLPGVAFGILIVLAGITFGVGVAFIGYGRRRRAWRQARLHS